MATVMQELQPDVVYVSFRGVPNEKEMRSFRRRLSANLAISTVYLRARLFSVAIVSAIACLTGGDAPKAFFFGDVPSPDSPRPTERLGDGLHESRPRMMPGLNDSQDIRERDEVYDILCGDRMSETAFDTRNAPLAAFWYKALGDNRICGLLEHCTVPMTEASAWKLLKSLPPALVQATGKELSRIAVSRSQRISSLLEELAPSHP